MTTEDRAAIVAFAKGNKSLRSVAITAFEREVKVINSLQGIDKKNADLRWNSIPVLFMREITSPCPDLTLRAKYRQSLCGGKKNLGPITDQGKK